jgi:hypothetical protein
MPLAGDTALAPIEALKQLWREVDNPAMHSGMVNAQTAFSHHFFEIAQAKIVSQIPAYTQQDHGLVEMATLEHNKLPWLSEALCRTNGKQSVCDRTDKRSFRDADNADSD